MPTVGERVTQFAEQRLGISLVPTERLEKLTESAYHLEQFREEASELAYHALDYFGGRPQEMMPEHRNRLAQRSRVALIEDPLAGAEANLKADFAFGRGIGKPDAVEEQVQRILDEFWSDPVNKQKLFDFEAQRHRSNQLLTDANLFVTLFIRNGRVRIGFLDPDVITHIVCDPEDDERPLYYVGRERKAEWNFETDAYDIADYMREDGRPRVRYWAHWRNVRDMEEEARANGEAAPKGPDAEKLAEGVVYHVRWNRITRSQFGVPPFARTLRFFSAMNDLTEAHVAMAHAASTIIAKRVIKGSPNAITAAANAVLAQTGELAQASFGIGEPSDTFKEGTLPPPPGSFWLENMQDRLESMKLDSGSGQAEGTARIVRAPIAAAAGVGQHYLGDASNADLASATTLELPALMHMGAWQETFEQLVRFLNDFVISVAAQAGRLGGRTASTPDRLAARLEEGEEWTPSMTKRLDQLWLTEELDKEELEIRTGLDLGYTFEMPYPGRRNLPDVVNAVTSIANGFDSSGMNVPLRRKLLLELAKHGFQIDDPRAWVDEVLPEDALDDVIQQMLDQQSKIGKATDADGNPVQAEVPKIPRHAPSSVPSGPGARKKTRAKRGVRGDGEQSSGYGEKRRASDPGREMGSVTAGMEELARAVDAIFEEAVLDPILTAEANGHGG